MKHPGTAAVLSLIIPGVGEFYNGDFLRGIFCPGVLAETSCYCSDQGVQDIVFREDVQ